MLQNADDCAVVQVRALYDASAVANAGKIRIRM